MESIEKRNPVKQLLEKGKASGKLTTQEIDAAIVEMMIDIEELDKLYETIESQHIEIIDNLEDDLSYENTNFDIDVAKTEDVGNTSEEKNKIFNLFFDNLEEKRVLKSKYHKRQYLMIFCGKYKKPPL